MEAVPVLSGLLAGVLHVFTGPDHLAAVVPLAARERARAWVAGALWGAGHMAGVVAIGFAARVAREALPISAVSHLSERLVGVALIALGLWGIRHALRANVHVHEHRHDGILHAHLHAHARGHFHDVPHRHRHMSFGMGLLHGVAGGSHLFGILPSLAFEKARDAAFYLLAYGVATVLSMTLFAGVIGGLALRWPEGAIAWRRFMTAASAAAVIVGIAWLVG